MDLDSPESGHPLDSKMYDVVITFLFTLGVGVNVYLIVDAATDGELSRSVSRWWDRQVRDRWGRYQTYLTDRPKVVAHAEWATYEAATEPEQEDDHHEQ